MQTRTGSQRVEVYNEGLAVFLHDPSNAPEFLRLKPESFLGMRGSEPSKDKALKQVVERGLLVTYTLRQDDPIVVDVCVGAPLSKLEIKQCGVPLMKPSQTVISLPSGRLRIDTANTFRLGAEPQSYVEDYVKEHGHPPNDDDLNAFGLLDKSGEISVPPGDYVITLYRVDFERLDDDPDDGEYDGPGEFITLTPAGEIERPKRIPVVLEYGAGHARVFGLRACKVVDGVFYGIMIGGCISNFSWPHAAKLGLRRGQKIAIEHDGKPYEAVYLGGIEPRTDPNLASLVFGTALNELSKGRPDLLTAAIHLESILKTPLLWIQTTSDKQMLAAERGSTLKITAMPDFLLPPPSESPVPQGDFHDGAVVGHVLASGAAGLELGCCAAILRRLKAGKSAELRLEIGGRSAPIILMPNAEENFRPYHIARSVEDKSPDFFKRVFSYMIDGGDEVFCAMLGPARAADLTKMLKTYKAGCTFNPRDGYVPKDEAAIGPLRESSVALWKEGMGRWNTPGAMTAALVPHWDDRKLSTLSCRLIAHSGENTFADCTGADFVLRRVE